MYSETSFADALAQYQIQRAASADQSSEVAQESQFEAAMCLLQLQRTAEAESLLYELLQLPGDMWPALAGITLWDEAVKQKCVGDADDIYTYLASTGNLTRIASLATEETRNRIVRSSLDEFDSIAGLLKPNPNRLQLIQRAAAIDQALSYDGAGTIDTQILLARAYRFEGDFDKAAEILANLLRRSRNRLAHTRLGPDRQLVGQDSPDYRLPERNECAGY